MLIHALIALAAFGSTPVEPIDPVLEVAIVEATFDAATVCVPLAGVVPLLGAFLGDEALAADMVIAYGVEIWEDGYGQNLTEEGEDALEALMRECLA